MPNSTQDGERLAIPEDPEFPCAPSNREAEQLTPRVQRDEDKGVFWNTETGRARHTPEKVPDRYNSHSELIKELEPGNNQVDLELQSK